MDENEIVIAQLGHHGLLLARYVGEWRSHGALVLTWTIFLDDTQFDIIDGDTSAATKAPLDGLEARGWVKPAVSQLGDHSFELVFEVTSLNVTTQFRWRVDTLGKRIEQWLR